METVTKTTKKTTPTGAHPTLPLKGERRGTLKTLDGKGTVYSPPDPKVREKAETYGNRLDEVCRMKTNANDAAQELREAFLKSKKPRRVTINGATETYTFYMESKTKLCTKKEKALK